MCSAGGDYSDRGSGDDSVYDGGDGRSRGSGDHDHWLTSSHVCFLVHVLFIELRAAGKTYRLCRKPRGQYHSHLPAVLELGQKMYTLVQ